MGDFVVGDEVLNEVTFDEVVEEEVNEEEVDDEKKLSEVEEAVGKVLGKFVSEKLEGLLTERIVDIINERYFVQTPKKVGNKEVDPFLSGLFK